MTGAIPLLLHAALAASAAAQAIDPADYEVRLGLAQFNQPKPAQPLFLSGHGATPSSFDATAAKVSYKQFFAGAGKWPIRFVFTADLDGDLDHEVVVIREKVKKQSRLDLSIVAPPSEVGAKKPKTIASFAAGAIGDFVDHGEGRVVAACSIDASPAIGDELVIVREFADGRQALEVFALPKVKKQLLGLPLATAPFAGQAGVDAIVDLAPVRKFDGSEVLALRRRAGATERLDVISLPAAVDAALSPAQAGYSDLSAGDGSVVRRVSVFRLGVGEPTALLFERAADSGAVRFEVVPPPVALDQTLSVVSGMSLAAAGVADGSAVFAAVSYVHRFTLDEKPPPPPPPPEPIDVDGAYALFLQYSNPWLCQEFFGCGTPSSTGIPPGAAPLSGPLVGFSGAAPNGVDFAMSLPAAGFLLDGGMGKTIAPDPYTNLLLKQFGANAAFSAIVNGMPGIADGSLLEFVLLDDDVRITKHSDSIVMFAAKAYGALTPPGGDPIPLGYACFVKQ
jgi:hypothetical protein